MFRKSRTLFIAAILALAMVGTGVGPAMGNHGGSVEGWAMCELINSMPGREGPGGGVRNDQEGSCGFGFGEYVGPVQETSHGFSRQVITSAGVISYSWNLDGHTYSDNRVTTVNCFNPKGKLLGGDAAYDNPNCQLPAN